MAELKGKAWNRLRDSVKYGRQKLVPFRSKRDDFLRQYVGFHYGENTSGDKVPMNLVELAMDIYTQEFCPVAPAPLVTSNQMPLRAWAKTFEAALGELIAEIHLEQTLELCVREAMVGVGVCKVALEQVGVVDGFDGKPDPIGHPMAESIELDDLVLDLSAKRWEKQQFIGDRYRVDLEEALHNETFDKSVRDKLVASDKRDDDVSGPRADELSVGSGVPEEFREHVTLTDLWLPAEKLVVTFCDLDESRPLRISEWKGPDFGPYLDLRFYVVPGNVMPLCPAAMWLDQHIPVNRVMNKFIRQVLRQKTILGVQGGAGEDGRRVVDASDGEAIRMDNPDRMREFRFGGGEQSNLAFAISFRDLFSYMGGNLDAIGGLGPQSGTVGQDQMISGAASKRTARMQRRTIDFTRKVMESLGFFLWNDPLWERQVNKYVPGVRQAIPSQYSPEGRKGKLEDYSIKIDPYSMQYQTPSQRLASLMQVTTQVVMPMQAALQQQGMTVDLEELMRLIGRYGNMPDLEAIVRFSGPGEEQTAAGGAPPQKPAMTNRTYTRVNRPGSVRQAKDEAMVKMLFGHGQQPSEQARMVRPAG